MFRVVPLATGAAHPPPAPARSIGLVTAATHGLDSALGRAAGASLADAYQLTLPPTKTLVLLGFVVAVMALLSGHPLIAAAFVVSSLVLAGFAAVVHEARLVSMVFLPGPQTLVGDRRRPRRRNDKIIVLILLAIARRVLRR